MGKVKHTPGPWFIWSEKARADIEEMLCDSEHQIMAGKPESILRGTIVGSRAICNVSEFEDANEDDEVRLANAHLIAAAPELLEAATKAHDALLSLHICEQDSSWATDIRNELRSAIAKAEGE